MEKKIVWDTIKTLYCHFFAGDVRIAISRLTIEVNDVVKENSNKYTSFKFEVNQHKLSLSGRDELLLMGSRLETDDEFKDRVKFEEGLVNRRRYEYEKLKQEFEGK